MKGKWEDVSEAVKLGIIIVLPIMIAFTVTIVCLLCVGG